MIIVFWLLAVSLSRAMMPPPSSSSSSPPKRFLRCFNSSANSPSSSSPSSPSSPAPTCLYLLYDFPAPPTSTHGAEEACLRTGGSLLELRSQQLERDFSAFLREVRPGDGGGVVPRRFFVNLRRIPSRNKWMWEESGRLLPAADSLLTNLGGNSTDGGCGYFSKSYQGFHFGADHCDKVKGYICRLHEGQYCPGPPCVAAYGMKDWFSARETCHLATAATNDRESMSDLALRLFRDVSLVGDFWIGLTRSYWTWKSTGEIVFPRLPEHDWRELPGADDCLFEPPSLFVVPMPGVAWGVVCMADYDSVMMTTEGDSFLVQTDEMSSSSSSSSSSSQPPSSITSLSSSPSQPPSLVPSLSPPSPPSSPSSSSSSSSSSTTTQIHLGPSRLPGSPQATTFTSGVDSATTAAIVLGACLSLLFVVLAALLIFRHKRRRSSLRERKADKEFHFSHEISADPVSRAGTGAQTHDEKKADRSSSFSSRILIYITSDDLEKVRPVTPTATGEAAYEELDSSFT